MFTFYREECNWGVEGVEGEEAPPAKVWNAAGLANGLSVRSSSLKIRDKGGLQALGCWGLPSFSCSSDSYQSSPEAVPSKKGTGKRKEALAAISLLDRFKC